MKSYDDALQELTEAGFKKYRVDQLFQGVFKEGIDSYDDFTTLPKDMIAYCKENLPIYSIVPKYRMVSRIDGTQKFLFELKDGKQMEAVLMRYDDKSGQRNTVCVSSQVGCALKCAFCATGKLGFSKNLTAEEIADQVLYFDHVLKKEGARVTNVVYMGMGEPFLNYNEVIKAARMLLDERALNLSQRGITISTSGVVDGIKRFTDENWQVNLAVSLHAPNQEDRASIMPIALPHTLPQLMASLDAYQEKTNRRISHEYVLLRGVNDTEKHARELAELIKGSLCHVNLIQYNETDLGFKKSTQKDTERFKEILEEYNIPVSIRISRGQDIFGACGQLAKKIIHKENDSTLTEEI